MGFSLDVGVPALTVFFQGLVSFFSPCVLPLIPLYIGYLSGGTGVKGEDGKTHYRRSKVMIHTICFILGVSFAFFLLGLGVSAAAGFFNKNQMLFARTGGILVIAFGLYQLGLFGQSTFLGRERRLPFKIDVVAMSPITALVMGFTFSFAWTPCVGPALTSVLLMAASASAKMTGFLLIGIYTLGFVLPFLAVGLFTTTVLEFFKNHMKVVQYTAKIGGVLMIIMGLLMFTGKMNAFTGYLSGISTESKGIEKTADKTDSRENNTEDTAGKSQDEAKTPPAIDFTLKDQYGNTHTLSDYKGKTVFLNFWATWCPPCKAELPDIQNLYENAETEGDEALIVLGVASPDSGNEVSEEEIAEFLENNGYTYPVLMDTAGEVFGAYGVQSLPTTFMIDKEGNVFGYVSGQLSADMMQSIVKQTMEGKRE